MIRPLSVSRVYSGGSDSMEKWFIMSDQSDQVDVTPGRETRLNLRATAEQYTLIRQAAQTTGKTVTDFVLDSASIAAEQILADRRRFLLDDDAWTAFDDLLERPAVLRPRLKELLEPESDLFGGPS